MNTQFTNARRGYIPKDDIFFSSSALTTMRTASRHICFLLNEGYDLKTASTFVGNHFALSERQRLAIARSIATNEQLNVRKAKQLSTVFGAEVWIDGFNTIISLEVMLSDSLLFAGMDGTIRDLAALRGTYKIIPETTEAARIMLNALEELNVASVHILLDEPVSNSGRLKALIADVGENAPFTLDIQILKEVDKTLWQKANVISTDSIILDHCQSWLNFIPICLPKHPIPTIQVWE